LDFAFFEELYRLLALSHEIVDENVEVLVGVEDVHLILIFGVDEMESLVGVG
jgi:hypothetical protein